MTDKVVIVGGGVSGLMAAISASNKGYEVIVVEKTAKLGNKLLISGGGRCNVTNINDVDEIIKHIPGNGRFLYSSLNQFSNLDIINFFEERGCKLKQEDNGRMFPISNKSKDILEVILNQLKTNKVGFMFNTQICDVVVENDSIKYIVDQKNNKIIAKHFIFATGGQSIPIMGTTGDGYKLLKKCNHKISNLHPVETPLKSNNKFIQNQSLKGLSLRDISIELINEKNKVFCKHTMDIIFTHFGISGPGALRTSSHYLKAKDKSKQLNVKIDIFPNLSKDELYSLVKSKFIEHDNKLVKNVLSLLVSEKISSLIMNINNIEETLKCKSANNYIEIIINSLKDLRFEINGVLGFDKSFVTGGGANLKQIDPKTMRSKIINNLSICGELLDINGYTGGYNITAALSSGYVSGNNI